MEHDLIVDEEYVVIVMNKLRQAGPQMDTIIEEYINILRRIKIDSIIFGETAKTLDTYIDYVEQMRGQTNYMAHKLAELYNSFKNEVNDKDSYLF